MMVWGWRVPINQRLKVILWHESMQNGIRCRGDHSGLLHVVLHMYGEEFWYCCHHFLLSKRSFRRSFVHSLPTLKSILREHVKTILDLEFSLWQRVTVQELSR